MSKHNKKINTPKKDIRSISPDAKKRAAMICANTLILTFIYFGSMGINQPILSALVTAGFWVCFAGFLVTYIVYNRGFTRRNITIEMLPDTWSEEKKLEYIEDGKKRYEASKWMLTVIIPLMIPIAFDAIYLFTWPIIQNLFKFK